MINRDLTELIRQRQKEKLEFQAAAGGVELEKEYRAATSAIIKSKTLTGDIFAIRSPEVDQDYKLEALERIARRHFSYRRLFYRSRRDVLTDRINALSTEARDWLTVWLHDISIPEIYIALNSEDINNTPVKGVFKKTRNLIRAAVETELLGKTLDSKRAGYQDYDDGVLYEGGKKQAAPAPFSIIIDRKTGYIAHTGENLQAIPYKHFYTGYGLEDRIIEIAAIRDIINDVGAKDIDYFLCEDPPESRHPELRPPKDQWPLINAKNYYIRKKIKAAAKRLGYY